MRHINPRLVSFFLITLAVFAISAHAFAQGTPGSINSGGTPGSVNSGGIPGSINSGGTPGSINSGGTPGSINSGGTLQNPLSSPDLATLLNKVLTFVAQDVGPVVVTLMLVYCGFLFVAARGNDEKLTQARTALLWTLVGALILLGAAVIEGVIASTASTL